jgi:peptidyl-prolyl cis-trans isomerase SurA
LYQFQKALHKNFSTNKVNTLANKLKSKYTVETNKIQYQNVEKAVNDAIYSQTWELPKENNLIKGDVLVVDKNKKIATNSFATYIHSQQKNKLTTKPVKKLVAELYESWKGEQLIAYYNDNLENEFPEFKNVMDEYRDGLLLFDLMENEIWTKSKTDTIGLQKYYEANKSKYNWKERYDVDILSSTDEKVIEAAQKMLEKGKSIEEIKAKFNKDNKVAIMVKSGLFEKNYDVLDKIPSLNKGVKNTYKDANYSFVVNVKNSKPVENKAFDDCKSRVINDYQQYLEATWVDDLKKEFIVNNAKPWRSVLYLKGHIMLYIGQKSDGEPLVIHDAWGIKSFDANGKEGRYMLGGIVITTLEEGKGNDWYDNEKSSLLNKILGIKDIE